MKTDLRRIGIGLAVVASTTLISVPAAGATTDVTTSAFDQPTYTTYMAPADYFGCRYVKNVWCRFR